MYRVLLFDADDTLFDFQACEQQALQETFTKYAIDFHAEMEASFHQTNADLWGRYEQGELSREEVVYTRFTRLFTRYQIDLNGILFEEDYQAALARGHQLKEGAFELLTALQDRYHLFIISNGVVATQYQRLHDAGLTSFFEKIFLSEEVGYRKPQPAFFRPVLEAANCDRREVLLIGDSLSSDIAGANHMEIDCVWMNPQKKKAPKALRINYEIQSLQQLYTILGLHDKIEEA